MEKDGRGPPGVLVRSAVFEAPPYADTGRGPPDDSRAKWGKKGVGDQVSENASGKAGRRRKLKGERRKAKKRRRKGRKAKFESEGAKAKATVRKEKNFVLHTLGREHPL